MSFPLTMPGPPEFYSGALESADPQVDHASSFEPIRAAAGTTLSGIDIVLNRQDFVTHNRLLAGTNGPVEFALGDFDEDGLLDFVATQQGFDPGNILRFYRNTPENVFAPPILIDSFPGNQHIVAGQFNPGVDTHLDIAVSSLSLPQVRVYFGTGTGSFGPPTRLLRPTTGASALLVGGDFVPDPQATTDLVLVVREENNSNTIYTYIGSPSGEFSSRLMTIGEEAGLRSQARGGILVGDFGSGDFIDVLFFVASFGSPPGLGLLTGDGKGGFTPSLISLESIGDSHSTFALTSSDFNGDGNLDLVVSVRPREGPPNFTRSFIQLLLGDGEGDYNLSDQYWVPETFQWSAAAADFDGDGNSDIASGGASLAPGSPGAKITVAFGDGTGHIRETRTTWALAEFPAATFPKTLVVGDFNRDQAVDLLVSDSATEVFGIDFPPHYSVLLNAMEQGPGSGCVAGDSRLCLGGGRFAVEVRWQDFTGTVGQGIDVGFLSPDSGMFYFFNPANWEMLVKVIDGCSLNGRVWVFAAATTDVGYTLTVTDTVTGGKKNYVNPLGNAAPAITDTQAFAACP